MIFNSNEPDRPRGLFTFNDGEGRYAFVGWSHGKERREDRPSLVNHVHGERSDEPTEISRSRAEEIAAELGIPIPSQNELIEIADERERERERERKRAR